MDPLTCICGRTFTLENALSNHRHSCQTSRKRLSSALEKAKGILSANKRRRIDKSIDDRVPSVGSSLLGTPSADRDPILSRHASPMQDLGTVDHNMSLAQRRTPRLNRLLPVRYRDPLPQPPPTILPANMGPVEASSSLDAPSSNPKSQPRFLQTARNIFGVVRRFFSDKAPSHDPEEWVTLEQLSPSTGATDQPSNPSGSTSTLQFHPYPNESSFRLGDWYWNGGDQKTKQGLKDLVEIVGDPKYNPTDVHKTNWDAIDDTLGSSADRNEGDLEYEWMDEDAGWKQTRIDISVPFHSRMSSPGARTYASLDLHHRSLVQVVKERLANRNDAAQFHMEPYDLLWKPTDDRKEVKLHGELYTSEAFIDAHRELQESPSEPSCDLQRVVVSLMFWSDATHLTSFGNAHLWPCYLFLGNESKYRRCKPSSNLCSHVAYFQSVRGLHLV